ncbi:MAG: NADP-specific glutamate dehydrogenase [Erysipelotrichaceae bacterium]|nr:NADP-specific glutamate dehydrogenase [Erysipelotrichaceae bacterium]
MNSYVEKILNEEINKHPEELEFNQALEEVLKTISVIFDNHPEYEEMKILEKLVTPDNIVKFKVDLKRDNGDLETYDGYRVQFNNSVGVYKGGLRFNSHVNESVLKALGFEQTFKNALTGLAMGGAKGGSNFDPKGKSEEEIKRFCESFMQGLANHIGEGKDVPAGDLGVGAREINYLYDAYKKIKNNDEEGFITGKPIEKNGSLVRKEATGYGLVYLLNEIIKIHPISHEIRVIISGSGNVAIYTAEKCKELGMKVVGMSDSKGYIIDENLDLEQIKVIKEQKRGKLSEYSKGIYHEGSIYDAEIKADIAIPCGCQNEIDIKRAQNLVKNGIKIVIEGANMPDENDAIRYYLKNNIVFVPGKAANAGGVSVSFFEMEQNRLKEKWNFEKVDTLLKTTMINIHNQCLEAMKEYKLDSHDYLRAANLASAKIVIDKLIKRQ